jgi:hypothetical protein
MKAALDGTNAQCTLGRRHRVGTTARQLGYETIALGQVNTIQHLFAVREFERKGARQPGTQPALGARANPRVIYFAPDAIAQARSAMSW